MLQIDAYERKHQNRSTITDKIDSLRGDEPWPGYDEQGVDGIAHALREVSTDTARRVRDYERAHQERTGVLDATDRRLSEAVLGPAAEAGEELAEAERAAGAGRSGGVSRPAGSRMPSSELAQGGRASMARGPAELRRGRGWCP